MSPMIARRINSDDLGENPSWPPPKWRLYSPWQFQCMHRHWCKAESNWQTLLRFWSQWDWISLPRLLYPPQVCYWWYRIQAQWHSQNISEAPPETTTQIDHIHMNQHWRHFLLDVRSFCGADVSTTHYLLKSRVRLNLSSQRRKKRALLPNLGLWTGEKVDDDQQSLCFNSVEIPLGTSQDEDWNLIKDAFHSASCETLGQRPVMNVYPLKPSTLLRNAVSWKNVNLWEWVVHFTLKLTN